MVFDRKEYMKNFQKKYRQDPNVKEKRKIESKRQWQKDKLKLEANRKFEKSISEEKAEKRLEPYKYFSKNSEVQKIRQQSKESTQTNQRQATVLFDAFDFIILGLLFKKPYLLSFEISNRIGVALPNLQKHIKRLMALHFIEFKREKQKKLWHLTQFGEIFLYNFEKDISNFIINVENKKAEKREGRAMLMELLIQNAK
ncbi:MAG: winged helix-turn-helix domain-containing protein [Candidatus Pacearchaeota archaeon]|jgi:hypothetical protein